MTALVVFGRADLPVDAGRAASARHRRGAHAGRWRQHRRAHDHAGADRRGRISATRWRGSWRPTATSDFGRFRRLGTPDELERVIHQERIAQVVIALPSASHEAIMRIVDHCRHDGVQFRLVPDLYEVSLGRLDIDTVNGIPLMGMKEHAILGMNFVIKRLIDITVALVVLVAVLVVLPDPGAAGLARGSRRLAAFGQVRVGRGGRDFNCCKFRSMRPSADRSSPSCWSSTKRKARSSRCATIRGGRGRPRSCVAGASTSCRSSGTCDRAT